MTVPAGPEIPWEFCGTNVQIYIGTAQLTIVVQPLKAVAPFLQLLTATAVPASGGGVAVTTTQNVTDPSQPTTLVLSGLVSGVGYSILLQANSTQQTPPYYSNAPTYLSDICTGPVTPN